MLTIGSLEYCQEFINIVERDVIELKLITTLKTVVKLVVLYLFGVEFSFQLEISMHNILFNRKWTIFGLEFLERVFEMLLNSFPSL